MRASALRTTKKKNMKNPWRELKKTNSHWRAKAALGLGVLNVNTDRTHVSPSKLMIPERDKINLMASFGGRLILLLANFRFSRSRVCLTRTTMTVMKIHALKSIMRRIGPRNAPKKTPMWLIKQLKEGEKEDKMAGKKYQIIITIHVYKPEWLDNTKIIRIRHDYL